ncbi:gag-pol fusion protein-like protein [Leptotrombidium deliense]|uniref:Gag-pol fusion protein-like protein n=1 Tax=Leptotrombidium deliense TaxID=299467 RepID=A0A443RU47_9ACAR|nr:gag-pol fusion protein-like protein [Leptotrombidium deliense]
MDTESYLGMMVVEDKQSPLSFSLNALTSEEINQFMDLVNEFSDLFAISTDDLTSTSVLTHSIDTGHSVPVKKHPYRTSYSEAKIIAEQIDEMLKANIIEPSCSPWCSPVVLVKKNGDTFLHR